MSPRLMNLFEPIWGSLKGFHRQRDLRTAVLQDSIGLFALPALCQLQLMNF